MRTAALIRRRFPPYSAISRTCTSTSIDSFRLARFCRHQLWTRAWSISAVWTEISMRSSRATWAVLFLFLIPALLSAQTAQHDRTFWQTIAQNHYAVPQNQSAAALAQELSQLLASPDPE